MSLGPCLFIFSFDRFTLGVRLKLKLMLKLKLKVSDVFLPSFPMEENASTAAAAVELHLKVTSSWPVHNQLINRLINL